MRLSKIEKLKLISKIVKAASATATGSAIIAHANEYLTLTILVIGAAADQIISFIKDKENEKSNSNPSDSSLF